MKENIFFKNILLMKKNLKMTVQMCKKQLYMHCVPVPPILSPLINNLERIPFESSKFLQCIYQTWHLCFLFIGDSGEQLNSLANSGKFDIGPITL